MKHRPLSTQQLDDMRAEEIRRAHAAAISALQQDANERASVVIENVELPDSTDVPIAHRLGRAPRFVSVSAPRGAAAAGYINEIRTGVDRTRIVKLRATSFGATITVDIEVRL